MTYPPQQPGPYGPQDPYGQQPYGQQPQYGAPQWGQPAYPVGPPPKKSRTGLITALVVVAVLLVGGGVAAFLLLRDGNGGSAGGGGTPREAADAFAEELGTQLSKPVEDIDLDTLRSLTCGSDFGKLSDELADAREFAGSASKKPDPEKVTFAVSGFKETGDGATFEMTPKHNGEEEDPLDMKVLKENDNWVACGLYNTDEREAPGSGPTSGGGGASIPNPIPKTS